MPIKQKWHACAEKTHKRKARQGAGGKEEKREAFPRARVLLVGNPNVGKSTLFNALTGMHQHTGNWTGKTVGVATGRSRFPEMPYEFVDLPGTYSLVPLSAEEAVTGEAVLSGAGEAALVVCAAAALERNLLLVMQTISTGIPTVVCINLLREAAVSGIRVNAARLQQELGVPVVLVDARHPCRNNFLAEALKKVLKNKESYSTVGHGRPCGEEMVETALARVGADKNENGAPLVLVDARHSRRNNFLAEALKKVLKNKESYSTVGHGRLSSKEMTETAVVCVGADENADEKKGGGIDKSRSDVANKTAAAKEGTGIDIDKSEGTTHKIWFDPAILAHPQSEAAVEAAAVATAAQAAEIAAKVLTFRPKKNRRQRFFDICFSGKITAFPVMFLLLSAVLWLTVEGANLPSAWLSAGFSSFGDLLREGMNAWSVPEWFTGFLLDGVYTTVTCVVSVMLPPMAIFFPLFTLLEDFGYLPRVAYNLDRCFQRCHACGKQALTTCMGLGCNAVGVTGCRIIDSPRERKIAMLTNAFIPCNGKFPTVIALIAVFGLGIFPGGLGQAVTLALILVLCIAVSMLASRFLAATFLRGMPSSFLLELPPYRRPQVGKVIVRSLIDRTLHVLARAAIVAAPAGALLWLLGSAGVLAPAAQALNPLAKCFGLDGALLLAFLLSLPANEITLPVAFMILTGCGNVAGFEGLPAMREMLVAGGWTIETAVCATAFMLFHWPCSTTLLTIRRETGKWRWCLLAALLPTLFGLLLCALLHVGFVLFG